MAENTTLYRYEEIPEVFLTLLEQRGIAGREKVEAFLYPRLDRLPSPFAMKGMQEAVDLILTALAAGRNIVLWGDYDVDGTTGTALLIAFFRSIGREVTWHIPDRLTEGYGLNLEFLRKTAEELNDCKYLLITIDCGIGNFKEVEELQTWGAGVIVTDHHQIADGKLPPCIVLNPHQEDCGFIGEHLAGVGVAFYLAAGIRAQLRKNGFFREGQGPSMKPFLAYTALGSIADMVPLRSTNRTIVRAGIEALQETRQAGLRSLLRFSEIHDKVFSEDIGFLLGPKINAAGRMATADLAVRLLVCEDGGESDRLVKALNGLNDERKKRCKEDLEKALTYIDPLAVKRDHCCILIGPFHHGILGITAARLLERLQVPVIVLSYADSSPGSAGRILKGSCRSLDPIDIFSILEDCRDHLTAYGGHSLAAGLTVSEGNFAAFHQRCVACIGKIAGRKKTFTLQADVEFPVAEILTRKNLELFALLDPFGQENKRPIFRDTNATIIDARAIGSRKEHLQLSFRGDVGICKGIGFSLGEKVDMVRGKRGCEVIYTLSSNRYKERMSWQIQVLDIH
jgi:single-stranded-DNA-specific exonuclease